MKTLNKDQQEMCRVAAETISNLEFLLKRDEFIAFMDRNRRQADQWADEILHDDSLSTEQRENLRHKRLGILAVLRIPEQDMLASRNILKGFGVTGD